MKDFQLYFIQTLSNLSNEEREKFSNNEIETKRIQDLKNEGIRYDSIMASWWAFKLQNIMLNRNGENDKKLQNGKFVETAIPTKKIQKLVDVNKIDSSDYQLIEDIESIIEWYEFAIHLDPHNYWAWYYLGFIHYKQNDFVHAENEFVQCIKNNSEWYIADNLLAKIYRIQGFYNKAISTINSGLQKVQEDYEAHTLRSILETIADMTVTRAGIFLEAEKYEDALNDYDFCINLILEKKVSDSLLFVCHMGKIAALKEFGTKSQIIDVYDSMLEKNPNDATTWNNVAYCHDKNEDSEKAIQCYNKALAIDSKLWTANLGVGEIYIKNGDREKAKPFIKDASRNCPQEYQTEILEMHVENIEKILDDTQNKSFQEQVKDLGGFSLSSDKEENDKLAVQMLQKCEEFIFWVEPFYTAGGLGWIENTCQQPSSVKKVKILTKFTGGKFDRDEIFAAKFRRKFDKLKNVLSIEGIELSMRICMDRENCKLHGRYIMTNGGRSWNFTSIMNFKTGSEDDVGPSVIQLKDFEDIWNKSLDYVKDQKEAEEKYEELKKNLDSEIT